MMRARAEEVAGPLLRYLQETKGVKRVVAVGS
jgi:hypothetical protein